MLTPREAIDVINGYYGVHPGCRALHAKGFFTKGTFTATAEAARLTRATHMQGDPVDVTARLSTGSGKPLPDYVPEVRGLAVSFHLPDGSRTDILGQTAPRFPVNDVDGFFALVKAANQGRAWRMPLFLASHPKALASMHVNLPALRPPPSFANLSFFPIHAFLWVDADGGSRYVRYTWLPEAGEERISPGAGKALGRDYLKEEMAERLSRGPVRWDLQLQIATDGDDPHTPSSVWSKDAETLVAGTLEVSKLVSAEEGGEPIVFDPARVTDGIELSDDPILAYRPGAYSESFERRTAPA